MDDEPDVCFCCAREETTLETGIDGWLYCDYCFFRCCLGDPCERP